MTKKRETSLNQSRIYENQEKYPIGLNNTITNIAFAQQQQPLPSLLNEKEDGAVRLWLSNRLKEKLQRASLLSLHSHKPMILYRQIIEETESAVQEEISYVVGNHIVHMIYAYGGFVPTTFQKIDIFTLDKFTKWIMQAKRKNLLLQCIDSLDQK